MQRSREWCLGDKFVFLYNGHQTEQRLIGQVETLSAGAGRVLKAGGP